MTSDELRAIEKRWQALRAEAVGGIAKQACADVQAVIDELRRRDKAHRQATDAEAAITGALLDEYWPTKIDVKPLLAGQDARLHVEGRHYVLHGDMDLVQTALDSYDGVRPLVFWRGDNMGIIELPDEPDSIAVRNALWDYLVTSLTEQHTLSGWHNASHTTTGGQRKD